MSLVFKAKVAAEDRARILSEQEMRNAEYRRKQDADRLKHLLLKAGIEAEPDGPTITIDGIRFAFREYSYDDWHTGAALYVVGHCPKCDRDIQGHDIHMLADLPAAIDAENIPIHDCDLTPPSGASNVVPARNTQRERIAKERRRFALLQASIAMYWAGYHENVDDWTYSIAVQEAEKILREIEAREGAE